MAEDMVLKCLFKRTDCYFEKYMSSIKESFNDDHCSHEGTDKETINVCANQLKPSKISINSCKKNINTLNSKDYRKYKLIRTKNKIFIVRVRRNDLKLRNQRSVPVIKKSSLMKRLKIYRSLVNSHTSSDSITKLKLLKSDHCQILDKSLLYSFKPYTKTNIYRCEAFPREVCCCNCNSDAMFEVMKSLYDCYRKRDCTGCKCYLCGPGPGRMPGRRDWGTGINEQYGVSSERIRKAKEAGFLTPLAGKTTSEREKILRGLANNGIPLPEGVTASEKKLIEKVRKDLGLPPPPTTSSEKQKMAKAYAKGLVTPLQGKSTADKERVLRKMAEAGIPMPEGRTPSEKSLIAKVKKTTRTRASQIKLPSEKIRKAKAAGLLTPLQGKSSKEKEKILRGLAEVGIPLPEGTSSSERKLIRKIKQELGLPAEPTTISEKEKLAKGYAAGIITPLEGKTKTQKEEILKKMADAGVPLPEGRTASEKAMIEKVKAARPKIPSDKLRKAKADGLLTPLEGKSSTEKERILEGLAKLGVPLPEGKTSSERKLVKKVRKQMGLPSSPETPSEKVRVARAYAAGMVTPLEGKSKAEKEKILRRLAAAGVPLPEGRTESEKKLINKVKATTARISSLAGKSPKDKEKILKALQKHGIPLPEGKTKSERSLIERIKKIAPSKTLSERIKAAKAEGFVTPLAGKTSKEREHILRGLAKRGLPLPEGKTESEKKIINKVAKDMGLPPEPRTNSEKEKLAKLYAAGLITPLEGKTKAEKEKILRNLAAAGVALPEGRTESEKELIDKVKATTQKALSVSRIPSEKLRRLKDAGLLTPLDGKTKDDQERILKGLAKAGVPLPEGKTSSQRKLVQKVIKDMGLPPEPKSRKEQIKYDKAYAAGIITPLEGKTAAEKEKALRKMAAAGINLPEGRTESEQNIINKVKATAGKIVSTTGIPPEKLRRMKEAGLLTPLEGKTEAEKLKILNGLAEAGIPLPEGKTSSEKKLIQKVRKTMGLPTEPKTESEKINLQKAYAAGIVTPLEGKTNAEKEKVLRKMAVAGVPLPEGRTASEQDLINKVKATTHKALSVSRIPSEKLQKIKEAGLLTPLEGKPKEEQERILRGLAKAGVPLPEGKTSSQRKLVQKVIKDMGLPPEPKSKKERDKYDQAYAAGIITPLEGKTAAEKENILRKMAAAGISLPEGRTKSEQSIINKVKATTAKVISTTGIPPEKLRKMKEAGLLTPLEGKTESEKLKILHGLAKAGIPLPEGKTSSERKLTQKVRKKMGLPSEPRTESEKVNLQKAYAAGIVTPLEGKTKAEKEQVLRKMAAAGVPLPEGRTASEQDLINKVKATTKKALSVSRIPSEKLRKLKDAGLLTPLEGKKKEEQERILKGLAKAGVPLPEGKTSSQRKLVQKVIKDMGLPPEPKSRKERDKYDKAYAAGLVTPLEGKTDAEKEKALRRMAAAGINLPEGRTKSEQNLIDKVKATTAKVISTTGIPPEKLRKMKEAGLLTPLEGKTESEKFKILKEIAKTGAPLPEGKTASEKKLIQKVRKNMGLPSQPQTESEKIHLQKAYAAGIVTPLEGKTTPEKEKALRKMAAAGVPLPEGRTASEKDLIAKVKATTRRLPSLPMIPSEKIRRLKEAGLLTPLQGKSQQEKERILTGLAQAGVPLPRGKTLSEKKLIEKIRDDLGLPPEPKTSLERLKMAKMYAAGKIVPLKGKTASEKESVLKNLAINGVPLPEGKTASEKSLIKKIKESLPPVANLPSEKIREAKAAGLLTPLTGKSSAEKERILRGLAERGIPLPEGRTPSDKKIIRQMKKELGLPPEPKSQAEKEKLEKAFAAGLITPLEGKTPIEKEKALRRMAAMGIPLPEGRTSSEKALIDKVKATPGPAISITKIPTEKLREMKRAGLLTPLHEKTEQEKENILKAMAEAGLNLPEGKTSSDKKIIRKIRKDLGLPPEPRTTAEKEKLDKAYAAGLITPLEGKTKAEKERALRRMAAAGIPLPEGRTSSEKALIDKVKATTKQAVSITKIPTDKLREMKQAGILTPLQEKTDKEKAQIFREMAKGGIQLPEGKTSSERKFVEQMKRDLGLPPEPKSRSEKEKLDKAYAAGLITPLEGKTALEKERALRRMAAAGIPLPEGRSPSEKALIDQVKATTEQALSITKIPTEKLREMKRAGLLTPLQEKSDKEKEQILRGLAKAGILLPLGKTSSEKRMIRKVKKDLGLPPEPKTRSEKEKIDKAFAAGLITPLEGKTAAEKERALRRMAAAGIPLPEGRTSSEKALIDKVKATTEQAVSITKIPTDKLREMKRAGLLTPLKDKSDKEKEHILKAMAKSGIALPEGKTSSERKMIQKVKKDLGLPPEPKSKSEKEKLNKAYAAGLITPLEGKTAAEKERALRRMAAAGIPLPEGRSPSEKALIDQVKATTEQAVSITRIPTDKLREMKKAGLLTPLQEKSDKEKEQILRGMAKAGVVLPEGKTSAEKKLINKVKKDLGLPPEPKTRLEKEKIDKAYAAGLITPLEGKTAAEKERVLRRMAAAGIPLPEGRTSSEKALIDKVKATTEQAVSITKIPTDKLREMKQAGLLTPLQGKSKEDKEQVLKGMAKAGIKLPEGTTSSERKLIQKVKKDLGLPPEPKTKSEREKLDKAYAAGLITPLEGKTKPEKERALRRMAAAGIPLPEGRTPSEKALIDNVRATTEQAVSITKIPTEKLKEMKQAGLLTPLQQKSDKEKEQILRGMAKAGIILPEGKTSSEKKIIQKVKKDLGLPSEPKTKSEKEKLEKAYAAGLITPLEGKTSAEKERALRRMAAAGIPLPEGRTASEKALVEKVKATTDEVLSITKIPTEKLREMKEAGLLTGKGKEDKEQVLKDLAKAGINLPEGKTSSERKLVRKVKKDLGLPEPKTRSEKAIIDKAYAAGLITPLEGKTAEQKEKALRRMAAAGVPLPEGRTASERALVEKVKATTDQVLSITKIPTEKLKDMKQAGLLTPLDQKTKQEKEQIFKDMAKAGINLPEGKNTSEKKLIRKIKKELGLPPEPKTKAEKDKLDKAYAAGLITPLEGKSPAEKERILRRMAAAGVPLPEGRSPSEQALIDNVKATTDQVLSISKIPIDKLKEMKQGGLFTPLDQKSSKEKEQIFRGMAETGIKLPEGKTASEKKLIRKVKRDLGLPPDPQTKSEREKLDKAFAAGIITPLEGKSPAEKERALRLMAAAGVPLPEGRTASEKELIKKVQATTDQILSITKIPTEQLREMKETGLLTPLQGKNKEEKEKFLKALAKAGIQLPEGKTSSERKIIHNINKDLGLPPEPKSKSEKELLKKAFAAGIITPLEGKSPAEKERALRRMAAAGIPLPKGRTASEKALIDKVKATTDQVISITKIPTEKLHEMKRAGLLTPLQDKTAQEKEQILKGMAKAGIQLPEGKTSSDKKLIQKVKKELGLPQEPRTQSEKDKLAKAYKAGLITPLEGKTSAEKERTLRKMAAAGIPMPMGRTPSEKALIDKVMKTTDKTISLSKISTEKLRKMKDAGVLTPLKDKTQKEKEDIFRGLAKAGVIIPEGQTDSEKKLVQKVIKDMGLPPEPRTQSERNKIAKAYAAGLITPLEGKTPAEKERALRRMAAARIPLPEGRTDSEKALIDKVKATTDKTMSITKIPTEKLRKMKESGIFDGAKLVGKGIGEGGITEEIMEIEKTTKCDRACGCDRKKIKFKHSYIKIRVTSPDISSFCSCPDECIPGVKGGVFVDNQGIKVTVGRATGAPSFTPSSGSVLTHHSLENLESTSSVSYVNQSKENNEIKVINLDYCAARAREKERKVDILRNSARGDNFYKFSRNEDADYDNESWKCQLNFKSVEDFLQPRLHLTESSSLNSFLILVTDSAHPSSNTESIDTASALIRSYQTLHEGKTGLKRNEMMITEKLEDKDIISLVRDGSSRTRASTQEFCRLSSNGSPKSEEQIQNESLYKNDLINISKLEHTDQSACSIFGNVTKNMFKGNLHESETFDDSSVYIIYSESIHSIEDVTSKQYGVNITKSISKPLRDLYTVRDSIVSISEGKNRYRFNKQQINNKVSEKQPQNPSKRTNPSFDPYLADNESILDCKKQSRKKNAVDRSRCKRRIDISKSSTEQINVYRDTQASNKNGSKYTASPNRPGPNNKDASQNIQTNSTTKKRINVERASNKLKELIFEDALKTHRRNQKKNISKQLSDGDTSDNEMYHSYCLLFGHSIREDDNLQDKFSCKQQCISPMCPDSSYQFIVDTATEEDLRKNLCSKHGCPNDKKLQKLIDLIKDEQYRIHRPRPKVNKKKKKHSADCECAPFMSKIRQVHDRFSPYHIPMSLEKCCGPPSPRGSFMDNRYPTCPGETQPAYYDGYNVPKFKNPRMELAEQCKRTPQRHQQSNIISDIERTLRKEAEIQCKIIPLRSPIPADCKVCRENANSYGRQPTRQKPKLHQVVTASGGYQMCPECAKELAIQCQMPSKDISKNPVATVGTQCCCQEHTKELATQCQEPLIKITRLPGVATGTQYSNTSERTQELAIQCKGVILEISSIGIAPPAKNSCECVENIERNDYGSQSREAGCQCCRLGPNAETRPECNRTGTDQKPKERCGRAAADKTPKEQCCQSGPEMNHKCCRAAAVKTPKEQCCQSGSETNQKCCRAVADKTPKEQCCQSGPEMSHKCCKAAAVKTPKEQCCQSGPETNKKCCRAVIADKTPKDQCCQSGPEVNQKNSEEKPLKKDCSCSSPFAKTVEEIQQDIAGVQNSIQELRKLYEKSPLTNNSGFKINIKPKKTKGKKCRGDDCSAMTSEEALILYDLLSSLTEPPKLDSNKPSTTAAASKPEPLHEDCSCNCICENQEKCKDGQYCTTQTKNNRETKRKTGTCCYRQSDKNSQQPYCKKNEGVHYYRKT